MTGTDRTAMTAVVRTVGWVKPSCATQHSRVVPALLGRGLRLDPTYAAVREASAVILVLALAAATATSALAAGAEPVAASGWAASVQPKDAPARPPGSVRTPKAAARPTPTKSSPAIESLATPAVAQAPGVEAPANHATPENHEPAAVEPKNAGAAAPTDSQTQEYSAAVQQFCANIGPSAIEARTAWLQRTTAELEQQIDKRIAALEARIAEHKEWLGKRQEFARKVGDGLVQVFTKLKPEAAAQQIAVMDEQLAAALLVKLDAKVASALLSEVPAAKAARLSTMFATVAGVGARRADEAGRSERAGAKAEPVK
jgi:flagellar motility protein MotE (MotC chaperone)